MKKLMARLRSIDDSWFYQDPGIWWKLLTIFVNGDALIVVPFLVFSLLLIVMFGEFGWVILVSFYLVRFCGEMGYWFLQQFGEKTYRPKDFGMTKLSNNSLYIMYQLAATVWASLSLACLVLLLFT